MGGGKVQSVLPKLVLRRQTMRNDHGLSNTVFHFELFLEREYFLLLRVTNLDCSWPCTAQFSHQRIVELSFKQYLQQILEQMVPFSI